MVFFRKPRQYKMLPAYSLNSGLQVFACTDGQIIKGSGSHFEQMRFIGIHHILIVLVNGQKPPDQTEGIILHAGNAVIMCMEANADFHHL
jgi:hypothetical protein